MGVHHYRGGTGVPASILLGINDRSPARLERSLRQAVESEIERLIDMLDTLELDADLEPSIAGDDREGDEADDEPSLGFLNDRPGRGAGLEAKASAGWGVTDLEHDSSDDEDSDHSGAGDYEGLLEQEKGEGSDLGATADIDQREAWRLPEWQLSGGGHPATDGEPSLGWSENHGAGFYENQTDSPQDDRERDASDHEPEEAEPSLGSLNDHHDQRQWGSSGSLDLENGSN